MANYEYDPPDGEPWKLSGLHVFRKLMLTEVQVEVDDKPIPPEELEKIMENE